MSEYCYGGLRFISLDATSPKFFGFSELLTGLALMVLAWTIADTRYHFRIGVTPIPLRRFSFFVVGALSILTLLTDLWRAEQLYVPEGNIFTPASWQALLGGILLLIFFSWVLFAFILPPAYGKLNASRFAHVLYQFIIKGVSSELAVIANELVCSAKSLVFYSTDRHELLIYKRRQKSNAQNILPLVNAYANDILRLIADKRFCRVIIEFSPGTAGAIFSEIDKQGKYGIPIQTFAKNIVKEAIQFRDSFLYQETNEYDSGLIGSHRPLSKALFSNYDMVASIGTLLDPGILDASKWDALQFKVYFQSVLIVLQDFFEKKYGNQPTAVYNIQEYIECATSDLYKINGIENITEHHDLLEKLHVVVKFIKNIINIMENNEVPRCLRLRVRESDIGFGDIYDILANMCFKVIIAASTVKSPLRLCWTVQHNFVWSELFNFQQLNGAAGKLVKFKVRRLLYNEIVRMEGFPNFFGARIIGLCLNVMSFDVKASYSNKDSIALQKNVVSWVKKYYTWLYNYNPKVADECLVDGIVFDSKALRLSKCYPGTASRPVATYHYLELEDFDSTNKGKEI